MNISTDRESRTSFSKREWMIDEVMFRALENGLSPLTVDMFAMYIILARIIIIVWEVYQLEVGSICYSNEYTSSVMERSNGMLCLSSFAHIEMKLKDLFFPRWLTQHFFQTLLETLAEKLFFSHIRAGCRIHSAIHILFSYTPPFLFRLAYVVYQERF